MSVSMVTAVIQSSPYLVRMSLSLVWTYITLNRRVNRTRIAFEKHLIQQGMSEEDAKRLSTCFEDLKSSITGMLKQGIRLAGN